MRRLIELLVSLLATLFSLSVMALSDLDMAVIERSDYAAVIKVDINEIEFDKELGHVHAGYIKTVFKGKLTQNAVFIELNEWLKKRIHDWRFTKHSHEYLIYGKDPLAYENGLLFSRQKYFLKEFSLSDAELFNLVQSQEISKNLNNSSLIDSKQNRSVSIRVVYDDSGQLESVTSFDKEFNDQIVQIARQSIPSYQDSLKGMSITLNATLKAQNKRDKSMDKVRGIIEKWRTQRKDNAN